MDGMHDYEWKILPPGFDGALEIKATSTRRVMCPAFSAPWSADHTRGSHPIIHVKESGPATFLVNLSLKPVKKPIDAVLSNPIMPVTAVLWIHIHAAAVMYKGVGYVDPPPGARPLGLKDLFVHLFVFGVAILGLSVKKVLKQLWRLWRLAIACLQ